QPADEHQAEAEGEPAPTGPDELPGFLPGSRPSDLALAFVGRAVGAAVADPLGTFRGDTGVRTQTPSRIHGAPSVMLDLPPQPVTVTVADVPEPSLPHPTPRRRPSPADWEHLSDEELLDLRF